MEKSESGSPIYVHEERKKEFQLATGDSENIEAINNHIEKYIGTVETVYHELISDLIHIDIHIVAPTKDRNFYTLITSGMSDIPMNAPEEYSKLSYSELLICLPPDWKMSQEDWGNENNYWPIRVLKFLSRFPHEYQTWLWSMHTIPNGNPPEPFTSNTNMTGTILLPPVTIEGSFHELKINSEKTIHFHAVIPLHDDEMELKLKKGAEALFDGFDRDNITELLSSERPSIIRKRKPWFGFGRK